MVNRDQDSERKFFEVRTGLSIYMCWRKVVNKAQLKLKFPWVFFSFFFFFAGWF